MTTSTLIEQVLALPLEERVGLAEALWQSIGDGLTASDERDAIEQAIQRDAELTSGTVRGRTHKEVMDAAATKNDAVGETSPRKPIWDVFKEITASIPDEEWEKFPTDGSEQHDHYLYGTDKHRAS